MVETVTAVAKWLEESSGLIGDENQLTQVVWGDADAKAVKPYLVLETQDSEMIGRDSARELDADFIEFQVFSTTKEQGYTLLEEVLKGVQRSLTNILISDGTLINIERGSKLCTPEGKHSFRTWCPVTFTVQRERQDR